MQPQLSEETIIWLSAFGMAFSVLFWFGIFCIIFKIINNRNNIANLRNEVAYLKGKIDQMESKSD